MTKNRLEAARTSRKGRWAVINRYDYVYDSTHKPRSNSATVHKWTTTQDDNVVGDGGLRTTTKTAVYNRYSNNEG